MVVSPRDPLPDRRGDEFEPGSDGLVLRNLLGITDPQLADRAEAFLLREAQAESFRTFPADRRFDVELIQALHRSWLGNLYPFAGEIRTVDLSKGAVRFAPVPYMEGSLRGLDAVLAEQTPCTGMEREALVRAVARVHGELVLVHPFREGNGRIARWVADLMSLQAGYPPLDWGFGGDTDAVRERYFAALRRAFLTDYVPLEALVAEALDRGEGATTDPPR
ncbi:cell filamentation protein Fic [bacterium]|nr:MAG: cell filamentation protein Fic [bacterium]